jgi:hypothetical protein
MKIQMKLRCDVDGLSGLIEFVFGAGRPGPRLMGDLMGHREMHSCRGRCEGAVEESGDRRRVT